MRGLDGEVRGVQRLSPLTQELGQPRKSRSDNESLHRHTMPAPTRSLPVPHHHHAEVHAEGYAGPAHVARVELLAQVLGGLVEAVLAQQPVQRPIERVLRRAGLAGRHEQRMRRDFAAGC